MVEYYVIVILVIEFNIINYFSDRKILYEKTTCEAPKYCQLFGRCSVSSLNYPFIKKRPQLKGVHRERGFMI